VANSLPSEALARTRSDRTEFGIRFDTVMFEEFDLGALRRIPRFAFYFRYPLHHRDFHVVRDGGRLLGHLAAKPLYGRLTSDGKVDRSAGFNGQVAVIFIPARARTPSAAKLLITKMPRRHVTKADGRRNWEAIYMAAENAVRKSFGAH
jgi:hypothetical protein